MYNSKLELRVCGSAIGDNLRVSFENSIAISIHYEEIRQEALKLGGNIVNESLILFTSSTSLMKLVAFIATL